MVNLLRRREMLVNQSRLPYGYQEVEYIESTATYEGSEGPCIDTGYKPTKGTRFYIRATQHAWQWQCRDAHKSKDFSLWYTGAGAIRYSIGNVEVSDSSPSINFDLITEADANGRTFTVKNGNYVGSKTVGTNPTWTCTRSLAIFENRNSPTTQTYSNGKVYEAKLWNSGVLVRDFVPCYRKADGEIGMFDLVTNTFFGNSGTAGSSFSKGGNV